MPDWVPTFITPQLLTSVVVLLVILHLALGVAAYFILLERKVCAWIQDRIGPRSSWQVWIIATHRRRPQVVCEGRLYAQGC